MKSIAHAGNLTLVLALACGVAPAGQAHAGTQLIDPARTGDLNVVDTQVGREQDRGSRARAAAGDMAQTQRGENNFMRLHIGNAQAGGRSEVTTVGVKQSQHGSDGVQRLMIGNAAGRDARSSVEATDLLQDQRRGGSQTLSIGEARDGGRADVRANHIDQTQDAGADSRQVMHIGAAHQGATRVMVRDLLQYQQGDCLMQSARIGLARHGAGSRAEVTTSAVSQLQSGRNLVQKLSIGNALNTSASRVTANDINQSQSGEDNTHSLAIGDAAEMAPQQPAAR